MDSYAMPPEQGEIVRLSREGIPESLIVKQLGLKRYIVRNALVFEAGRQTGLLEAASSQRENAGPGYETLMAENTQLRAEIAQLRADQAESKQEHQGALVPRGDGPNEELISALVECLRSGKHVPEKALRDKYRVSHNAMYKYRAVAADRLARAVPGD